MCKDFVYFGALVGEYYFIGTYNKNFRAFYGMQIFVGVFTTP
jgi:hypothetical protein